MSRTPDDRDIPNSRVADEHRDRLVEEVEGLPDDLFLTGHRTYVVRVLINARCHVLVFTSCDWKDGALAT